MRRSATLAAIITSVLLLAPLRLFAQDIADCARSTDGTVHVVIPGGVDNKRMFSIRGRRTSSDAICMVKVSILEGAHLQLYTSAGLENVANEAQYPTFVDSEFWYLIGVASTSKEHGASAIRFEVSENSDKPAYVVAQLGEVWLIAAQDWLENAEIASMGALPRQVALCARKTRFGETVSILPAAVNLDAAAAASPSRANALALRLAQKIASVRLSPVAVHYVRLPARPSASWPCTMGLPTQSVGDLVLLPSFNLLVWSAGVFDAEYGETVERRKLAGGLISLKNKLARDLEFEFEQFLTWTAAALPDVTLSPGSFQTVVLQTPNATRALVSEEFNQMLASPLPIETWGVLRLAQQQLSRRIENPRYPQVASTVVVPTISYGKYSFPPFGLWVDDSGDYRHLTDAIFRHISQASHPVLSLERYEIKQPANEKEPKSPPVQNRTAWILRLSPKELRPLTTADRGLVVNFIAGAMTSQGKIKPWVRIQLPWDEAMRGWLLPVTVDDPEIHVCYKGEDDTNELLVLENGEGEQLPLPPALITTVERE